ncbi:MAG: integration host factor subunit beta [Spirochaetaceae bacterium]|jgi:integration host factor subunit beta|nr:integration host factor subunit beta [Spirochaetaceae bacterium]
MHGEKSTKADILNAIYQKSGMRRRDVRSVFDMVFAEIKDSLAAGKLVELRGIGTFELRVRKGRKAARNPRTGETVCASAHRVVAFRPGHELRLSVWNLPVEPSTSCPEEANVP